MQLVSGRQQESKQQPTLKLSHILKLHLLLPPTEHAT
jgi:hypothetical protein